MDKRPPLSPKISLIDFQEFYWLKAELVKFCKEEGLPSSGAKLEIAERITLYLKTGKKQSTKKATKVKASSKFDWNNAPLHLDTIITDNYKNSENVRTFFRTHIGATFKFNVKFMNWMKANTGKTLWQAMAAWSEIKDEQKSKTAPKDIAPQFEYNCYLRDYLADNPKGDRRTGIQLWKIKRSQRGDNIYRKEDLGWLE